MSTCPNYTVVQQNAVVNVDSYILCQWAFGITGWEAFSLGLHPYPSISTSEICDHVTNGGVPNKPVLSSDEMCVLLTCSNYVAIVTYVIC